MKILHFVEDDKFIPFVQDTFEDAFPGGNQYRVLKKHGGPMKFVVPSDDVLSCPELYWSSDAVDHDMEESDCLIVHCMTQSFLRGVARAKSDLLIMWSGWGADYAHLMEPELGSLLLEDTKKLSQSLDHRARSKKTQRLLTEPLFLYSRLRKLLGKITHGEIKMHVADIAHKLDLIWVNPDEVERLEKALPTFSGQYHRICYYSAEKTFSIGPERMEGPDILVGNSATPTNNHLEIFASLKKLKLGDRRIIVPLSYGDEDYAREIITAGESMFGERFVAITDFIGLEDYYEEISSCGTVIMNSVRQQAGTTIAAAAYKGAKVFLRNENVIFQHYRELGLQLFSVQDDLPLFEDFDVLLSEKEVCRQREILVSYWGHDVAVECARDLQKYLSAKGQQRV